MVTKVCLRFVIMVFHDHTHLLFLALGSKLFAKNISRRLARCELILVYNNYPEGIRFIYVRLE